MSTRLRDHHRNVLCDALASVAATAPTLCQEWDAHDLAVHLWALKRDPLSWPGVAIPAFADATRRRAEQVRRRWDYEHLIAELRQQGGSLPCMPLDRWVAHGHALGEYYIHTQDVRRANDLPRRAQTAETEDALWLRARRAGRQLWLRGRDTVSVAAPGRDPFTLGRGAVTAQVTGLPSEIILWIYGRCDAADVVVTPR
ncbi:maleylpyruvate isomerase family mycothiol-dependent enzyme [Tessaracoccus antarcticus]|uniref:Maleylpyruvate isomerase family mycothiol-dependent enzyme n=1 Tax=Tessaracoccus antarcticus TaxID=2479848 RepID=A0A3M0G330_9ACTN|nr:maleylpyruvate isomerase family mycothiol-dependent enzyme [Tessaracoccus antarcticus]RMB58948.1 maleylpyruvate isomerase family mycothiol-dependent enzyme [Tessaracoccus antarcticus]